MHTRLISIVLLICSVGSIPVVAYLLKLGASEKYRYRSGNFAVDSKLRLQQAFTKLRPQSFKYGKYLKAFIAHEYHHPVRVRSPTQGGIYSTHLAATIIDFEESPEVAKKLPLTDANIEAVLSAEVRPALESDGGGVELVCIDGSAVHVKLRGACSNCPRSFVTLQSGVLKKLQERIEGIERIVQIVDEI